MCLPSKERFILIDEQLNIPENNDNIPDILNELECSLLIHYQAQEILNKWMCIKLN